MFAAGHATESFSDFVVGHGELWSAQMLSYAIKKVHMVKVRQLYSYLQFEQLTKAAVSLSTPIS
jgi:aspartokinase/homoserine dehydrogenase 1